METANIANRVESNTKRGKLGFLIEEDDENFDSFTNVEDMTEEELAKVAVRYQVAPEFITEINDHLDALRAAIHEDLADIWDKLP